VCARELATLADGKVAGQALDAQFLLSVTSAIEVMGIELERLQGENP
jgi:hypothetical protein